MPGAGIRHHLIDPQTGLPSDTDVTSATVVAGAAWLPEVLAKAVLLRGRTAASDILGGTGAEGLVVDDGRGASTPGLALYLGTAPPRTINRTRRTDGPPGRLELAAASGRPQ